MEAKTFNSRKRVLDSSGYESDIEHCFLSGPPRNRRRRDRTHFTESDLERLETAFLIDRYPDINTRETLAFELGVSEDRIHVWFQNRRSKSRRRQKRQQMMPHGVQAQQSQLSPGLTVPTGSGMTSFNPWGSSLPLITPLTAGGFSPAYALPFANTSHLNLPVPVMSPNVIEIKPTPQTNDDLESSINTSTNTPPSEPEKEPAIGEPSCEGSERKQKPEQSKDEASLPTSFKRPWETPSPESQSYKRTHSEQFPSPIMYPSRPVILPPLLPFSPLGVPGNGCLFLPHVSAPLPFVLPDLLNMN